MTYVLSLIAAKAKAPLTPDDVATARRHLHNTGASSGPEDWLSASEACDIPFDGNPTTVLEAARLGLAGRPFDINALPALGRRKRLLVADMDSTLIEQECIDELAAALGIGDAVSKITDRVMRGEIAFEPALVERVGLLKGLAVSEIDRILAERITIMPGAATLVATMRAHGAYTALVSGGFTAFTGPIAGRLGFDEHRSNRLVEQSGRLSGVVEEPILGREAKEVALGELSSRLGLEPDETLAVGDGANDIAMIAAAGLGVAYRAKPALRAVAAATIEHGDLTGLLFLQGYRRADFAG